MICEEYLIYVRKEDKADAEDLSCVNGSITESFPVMEKNEQEAHQV